ncbi:MAG: sec-independent protein translocase protein TatB [Pseudohongiellaceae bacterium]|jgi:sec-independent protein translocase protein TatB
MFNIAPTELLLVGIVALLVIGPERLPSTIKTVSLWVGRFRRSFYKVKNEIERELNADEIRRQLHNEAVMDDLESAKSQMSQLAKDTEKSISNLVSSDELDPGAAKLKVGDEKESTVETTLIGDVQELGEEIEQTTAEIKQQLYGVGKNPKLGNSSEKNESE